MFDACVDDYLVPCDGSFRLAENPTAVDDGNDDRYKRKLADQVERVAEAQRVLYAQDRYSVLLVFQAMDAAGKDSTIRAVLSGVNPAGCQVFAFKKPSARELDHDFLWRTSQRLPERGRIGVFNRSYYEEVLVVKVHPEILNYQQLPLPIDPATIWEERYESIRDHEKHMARNGTIVLKFWLNVSQGQQHERFLARLENPDKQWKFSGGDVAESRLWPAYMQAYEDALNATSRPWAPWYAIPADDKRFMRYQVAKTIADSLESLDLHYPEPSAEDRADFDRFARELRSDG